jgi:hypothetical protein
MGSPMRFMDEEVIWDSETGSSVRFRRPFEMPSWDGVTDNEVEYIVSDSWMRIDILARHFYGNEEMGWIIAARNNMDLPDVELYPGRSLKIPTRSWVERTLLRQGR